MANTPPELLLEVDRVSHFTLGRALQLGFVCKAWSRLFHSPSQIATCWARRFPGLEEALLELGLKYKASVVQWNTPLTERQLRRVLLVAECLAIKIDPLRFGRENSLFTLTDPELFDDDIYPHLEVTATACTVLSPFP